MDQVLSFDFELARRFRAAMSIKPAE